MKFVADILRQNIEGDLLRLCIVGSVDDGKSTLIGRLLWDSKNIYEDQLEAVERDSKRLNREEVDLALVTDGLRAEREQGITIDVAYRYFSTPKRRFIIADTPGHEQYTRNMATGASTADLAVLLVDARLGVLTQTRRHSFIASLLGIPNIVVAVNKMDLVGFDQAVFDRIAGDYKQFAEHLRFTGITTLPISALRGDNVVDRSPRTPWYRGPTIIEYLEGLYPNTSRNLEDFRFPVQLVLRPTQEFRGYAGTIASGVVRTGDTVMALPSRRIATVKSIGTADGEAAYAYAPQAVTVCLDRELDISRGAMLVHPDNLPRVAKEIEAFIVWFDTAPMQTGVPYLFKHTTNTVRGVVAKLHHRVNPNDLRHEQARELGLNEIGLVDLQLFSPMVCDDYTFHRQTGSFVVIDPVRNLTVGAGMIAEQIHHHAAERSASEATPVSHNINVETSLVNTADRVDLLRQRPVTLWMTGLSGAGKSTVARLLEKELFDLRQPCHILDGDNLRHGLNRDLGFSLADRAENIRRVAEVARLMNDAGLIIITAFISPLHADRAAARRIIGPERFIEIYMDASLAVCEARDVKGLYRKARAGEIEEFTGISSPYEAPSQPDLRLTSDALPPAECVRRIVELLLERGIIKARR